MSGFEGFDKYCEDNNISQDETPAAFGAYLNQQTGWDGNMGEVRKCPHCGALAVGPTGTMCGECKRFETES